MYTTFAENDLALTRTDSDNKLKDPRVRPSSVWYASVKHPMDCVLAVILLVLAVPLLPVTALIVKLTSRGPVIYSQTRLGRNGLPYTIHKIRTMYNDCESKSGACWSKKGDLRVTKFGRFLRLSHIDELPQLWNVLRGEMSLVGPRPERPEFVPGLEKEVPGYRERLRVRPGITGLAQVQLPPDTDMASVRRKLVFDRHYVDNLTFWLDLRILACTALVAVGMNHAFYRRLLGLPDAKPSQPGSIVLQRVEVEAAEEPLSRFGPGTVSPIPETQLESA